MDREWNFVHSCYYPRPPTKMGACRKENQQAANRLVEIYFSRSTRRTGNFLPMDRPEAQKSDFRPSCSGRHAGTGSGPGFGRVSFESASGFAEQCRSGLEQHSNNTRTNQQQKTGKDSAKTRITWFNRSR
jgi:hypothetical protein